MKAKDLHIGQICVIRDIHYRRIGASPSMVAITQLDSQSPVFHVLPDTEVDGRELSQHNLLLVYEEVPERTIIYSFEAGAMPQDTYDSIVLSHGLMINQAGLKKQDEKHLAIMFDFLQTEDAKKAIIFDTKSPKGVMAIRNGCVVVLSGFLL